jgi:hypothetical protein
MVDDRVNIAGVLPRANVLRLQVEHGQWFKWDHLEGSARTMSQKFAALAADVIRSSADVQTIVALEHLLIAKDAAVRAVIAAERQAVPEPIEDDS